MSKQRQFDQVNILGVDIDAISNADAINLIMAMAAPGQPTAYVVKPYVEFLDAAYSKPSLKDLLNDADLTIPDGVALNWAAAYLYAGPRTLLRFWSLLFQIVLAPANLQWPLPDRAAGITLTWPLLQAAAGKSLRIFLVGSPKGSTIGHTAETLMSSIPGLKIVGTHSGRDDRQASGHVSSEWLLALADAVRAAQPDLVLVGMGFPLQETVCAQLAQQLAHGVFIGEGGTFDYESFGGSKPKAPAWISRVGLEWFWRLAKEPSRVVRQLAIPRYIYRVWKSRA